MNTAEFVRVLLVEDSETDAFLVKSALRPHRDGFELMHVETLSEAREALENGRPFDVVVADLNLPDSPRADTLEFLFQIRDRLPVVVLDSCDDPELNRRCTDCGALCYSKQKLLEEEFIDALRAVVNAARSAV